MVGTGNRRWWQAKLTYYSLIVIAISLLFIDSLGLMMANYFITQRSLPAQFGVSFSPQYAEDLGLNWRAAYIATLTDLGVKQLRLMSYWDRYQPISASYNFSDLDWQMTQAAAHGARVVIVVGMRQPRWPECHIPGWAQSLLADQQFSALLSYIKTVVERYRTSPALAGWQVENEASNQLFGVCPPFNRGHFTTELNLVKSLDSNHKLITTVSNQIGLPVIGPFGQAEGFSIYRKVNIKLFGHHAYISYWFMPPLWHALRAAFVQAFLKSQPLADELQAEPWGPDATQNLSLTEQASSMNPTQLVSNAQFALRSGLRDVYFWGVEWWYWRKVQFHDPSLWETARTIFRSVPPN